MRKVAFQYPEQRFYIIIDPKEIPLVMGQSWDTALKKLRNVGNIKILGYVPKNGTRFHQDYIVGYQNTWNFDGIYFESVDYTYYELFKTLKQMINGTVVMNFAKSYFGSHKVETPHFWYGITDIGIDFSGDSETFKDADPIIHVHDARHAAEITQVVDYTETFKTLYNKKYNGAYFKELAFHDIAEIAYINKYTKNGRSCYRNIEDKRPCRRPKDILADLGAHDGVVYSEIYPIPDVYKYTTTGMTAVMPVSSEFINTPESQARRSRAFVRNLNL